LTENAPPDPPTIGAGPLAADAGEVSGASTSPESTSGHRRRAPGRMARDPRGPGRRVPETAGARRHLSPKTTPRTGSLLANGKCAGAKSDV